MNFDADDKKMLQVNILFLKKCQSDFCFMFFKFMTHISENYHGYHKQFFFFFWIIIQMLNLTIKNIINGIDKEKIAIYEANPFYIPNRDSLTRRPTAFHYFLCKIPIILPIVIWSPPPSPTSPTGLPSLDIVELNKVLRRSSDSNYIPNYISVTLDTIKNKKWSSQVGRPGYKKALGTISKFHFGVGVTDTGCVMFYKKKEL